MTNEQIPEVSKDASDVDMQRKSVPSEGNSKCSTHGFLLGVVREKQRGSQTGVE